MELRADNYLELEIPNGRTVRVLLRPHARARRISLSVGVGGPRLSMPEGTHPATLRAFLRQNAGWLQQKLRELSLTSKRLSAPTPGRQETFRYRGIELPVRWEQGSFPRVHIERKDLVITLNLDHPESVSNMQRAMRNFLLREMRREVSRLVAYFSLRVGRSPSGFRFMPMRTLWGSMSSDGRLTMDLSLILAPPEALEYVVVHELCHLWVRNHGPRFWARVAEVFPEVDAQRDWLNDNGHQVKHELSRWIGLNFA
ncbi:MAG: M48 family metallopeptidase [Lysobacterales bacterium]